MTANRKRIRHYFVDRLREETTLTDGQILHGQAIDLPGGVDDRQRLPLVQVYALEEPIELRGDAPRRYWRDLELAFEVADRWDGSSVDVADQVDELCEAVECVIHRHLALPYCDDVGVDVTRSTLARVELSYSGQGSTPLAAARIVLRLAYVESRDELILRPGRFLSAGVEWDTTQGAPPEARDDFRLPTS